MGRDPTAVQGSAMEADGRCPETVEQSTVYVARLVICAYKPYRRF